MADRLHGHGIPPEVRSQSERAREKREGRQAEKSEGHQSQVEGQAEESEGHQSQDQQGQVLAWPKPSDDPLVLLSPLGKVGFPAIAEGKPCAGHFESASKPFDGVSPWLILSSLDEADRAVRDPGQVRQLRARQPTSVSRIPESHANRQRRKPPCFFVGVFSTHQATGSYHSLRRQLSQNIILDSEHGIYV